jgi:hypothetical protein
MLLLVGFVAVVTGLGLAAVISARARWATRDEAPDDEHVDARRVSRRVG